ncbi:methyl-CpG-binding domain protein 2 isoform X6 [Trematomus bernacchii]|uniref:methyl-CpG-binding domain protein 2 isoform X6 n=1 Tax=Trematomus bernacchii TaxID=40690 RepID=UPI00146D5F26|nr:methyl-CpG-binding domain protein 2 isoform X6 [Trematomus bernacchii]
MMEKKRTECPALPPGWRKEEVIRKSGLSAGKSDVYYYRQCMAQRNRQNSDPSPSGKKFRSKPQLSRYLGNTVDLGCFDFRTGKMMPGKLQKNKQRLRNDPLSLAKGGKVDLNTALPIRQTAPIFKQPVTKVTSHPSNKVKTDLQRSSEQPRQFKMIQICCYRSPHPLHCTGSLFNTGTGIPPNRFQGRARARLSSGSSCFHRSALSSENRILAGPTRLPGKNQEPIRHAYVGGGRD